VNVVSPNWYRRAINPVPDNNLSIATTFGETTVTATREGIDQSEITLFEASQFGETTLTKTIEGVDQSELSDVLSSQFGETTFTRTREGADQDESGGSQAA
jgi:hypothetical protein